VLQCLLNVITLRQHLTLTSDLENSIAVQCDFRYDLFFSSSFSIIFLSFSFVNYLSVLVLF